MKRISLYLFLWAGIFLLQSCTSKRISQGKTPISVATIAPQGEEQKSPSMQVSTPPQEKEKQNKLAQKISSLQRGKNAILLVAFGSTWQEAHNAYNALQRELTHTFNAATMGESAPQDVYLAFTSEMCIQRCQQKGLGDFYFPHTWLAALAQAGYTSIVVQSLHVAQGKEYLDLVQEVNSFTQAYPSIDIALQGPLLDHAPEVAKILCKSYESELKSGATLLFMGHGTPKKYDIGGREEIHLLFEQELQKQAPRCFVATVDTEGNLLEDTIARMQKKGIKGGKVICIPLMTIAGDHAHNDMQGGDEDTPEAESWRAELIKTGYQCSKEDCRLIGLIEMPEIVQFLERQLEKQITRKR